MFESKRKCHLTYRQVCRSQGESILIGRILTCVLLNFVSDLGQYDCKKASKHVYKSNST